MRSHIGHPDISLSIDRQTVGQVEEVLAVLLQHLKEEIMVGWSQAGTELVPGRIQEQNAIKLEPLRNQKPETKSATSRNHEDTDPLPGRNQEP